MEMQRSNESLWTIKTQLTREDLDDNLKKRSYLTGDCNSETIEVIVITKVALVVWLLIYRLGNITLILRPT